MGITQAPFETFPEYDIRSNSDSPYDQKFISRCREKALEYSLKDKFLRVSLLSSLMISIPMHYRGIVFDGISFNFVK